MPSTRPKVFSIETERNPAVYSPGSVIRGNVVIELTERMSPVHSVMVNLYGKAYTYWTEKRGSGRYRYRVTYTNTEVVLNVTLANILPMPTNQPSVYSQSLSAPATRLAIELAPGRYKFPFNIHIKDDVRLFTSFEHPSTLFGPTAYIRYMLTAGISLSVGKIDHVAVKGITVINNIDTNAPNLLRRLLVSNEKTVCCLCCSSGPITMTVMTDRSAYCSGESICISVDYENHSKRRIDGIRANLSQTTEFYGKPEYHGLLSLTTLYPKITYGTKNRVIRRVSSSAASENLFLPIPVTTPTITNCTSIKVFYTLHVYLMINKALDLHVELPIVISTIPFRSPIINAPHTSGNHHNRVVQGRSNPISYSAISTDQVYLGMDAYTHGDLYYTPMYSFVDATRESTIPHST